MADKDVAEARGSRQCVVFSIGNEHYGIDIFQVREIIRVPAVTHVPGAPDDVQGVINLRGGVIPILDLRKRFGLGDAGVREQDRRIVVVEFDEQTLGIVVDGVSEVLEIDAGAIEPPSPYVMSAHSHAIAGIAKLGERLIILLELEALFTGHEKERLKQLADGDHGDRSPGDGDDRPEMI